MNRVIAGYPVWGWIFFLGWMAVLLANLGWYFFLALGIRVAVVFGILGIAGLIEWVRK